MQRPHFFSLQAFTTLIGSLKVFVLVSSIFMFGGCLLLWITLELARHLMLACLARLVSLAAVLSSSALCVVTSVVIPFDSLLVLLFFELRIWSLGVVSALMIASFIKDFG